MPVIVTGTFILPDGDVAADRVITIKRARRDVVQQSGQVLVPDDVVIETDITGQVLFDLMPGNYVGFARTTSGQSATFTMAVPDVETVDVAAVINADDIPEGAAVGPMGPPGPQGEAGPAGPQGPAGATGPQGPIGLTGPQGPQGLPGVDGDDGAQGPAGPQGLQGEVGPQGPIGLTGPQGPAGLDGDDGAQGPQGIQGETGPQGPIGLTGPQGPQGIQGATGPAGTNVTITTVNTQAAYDAATPTATQLIVRIA